MYRPEERGGVNSEKVAVEMHRRAYLSGLLASLTSRIIGQEAALERIARAIQAAELGLNEVGYRPLGSFLLLGPTGVGKTECAKCFTDYLFGSRSALEMLFMNEYSSQARLAEFVKRAEQAIRRHPGGGTLLFDEIEKAHPQLVDIFLSLLEEGELTSLSGERISIRKFYIVLTSNLGSGDFAKMENAGYSTMERVALDCASQMLRPELFARIAERIVFRPLELDVQRTIVEALIKAKIELLSQYFRMRLYADTGPVTAFLLRVGYSRSQGARRLGQEVDRQFNLAALDCALAGAQPRQGKFVYDATAGRLALY